MPFATQIYLSGSSASSAGITFPFGHLDIIADMDDGNRYRTAVAGPLNGNLGVVREEFVLPAAYHETSPDHVGTAIDLGNDRNPADVWLTMWRLAGHIEQLNLKYDATNITGWNSNAFAQTLLYAHGLNASDYTPNLDLPGFDFNFPGSGLIIEIPFFMQGTIGRDEFYGYTQDDTLNGYEGNDEIRGNEGDDLIRGGDDNDTLYGEDGSDSIIGGTGEDKIFGGEHNDTISGNSGDDNIQGNEGDDSLGGGSGADIIRGQGGDDTANGNSGDDTIIAGAGDDLINGGGGNDTLQGNSGDDTIFGSNGNDSILGGGNADVLSGGSGDDVLSGQSGDDELRDETGADWLDGGSGTDTFVFAGSPESHNLVIGDTPQIDQFSQEVNVVHDSGLSDIIEFLGNNVSGVYKEYTMVQEVDLDDYTSQFDYFIFRSDNSPIAFYQKSGSSTIVAVESNADIGSNLLDINPNDFIGEEPDSFDLQFTSGTQDIAYFAIDNFQNGDYGINLVFDTLLVPV